MNPQAAGVPGGRPSLHRVWNNNHYQHVSTSWRLYALDADREMLNWSRICTDYYASMGQVRYDGQRGRLDGDGKQIPGPQVKYHNPGAFWHCKAPVPWGGRDFGMDHNDNDSGLTGHWPDPSGLLYAWLIDANRWAKDGYELWLQNVKFPTEGTRREINTTLVHAITAYEYRPARRYCSPSAAWPKPCRACRFSNSARSDLGAHLDVALSRTGAGQRGIQQVSRAERRRDRHASRGYLVAGPRRHGLSHHQRREISAATCRHIGPRAREVFYDSARDKRWDRYGFAPGPDRDGHFMLQWPWFHAALKEAKIETLPAPMSRGNTSAAPALR